MDFVTSGTSHNWSAYEGCCNTAGKYYAITPKLKATDDYAMLTAINCRQYWVEAYRIGGPWMITSFYGPIPKP